MTRPLCFILPALLLLLSILPDQAENARILGVFPHVGRSHFIMFEALMKALVGRGHDVVVLSHFPQKTKIPHYTDISLVESMNVAYDNSIPLDNQGDVSATVNFLLQLTLDTCQKTFDFPPIQKLIHSDEKFDLVFYETFNTDCFLAFVHKFKAPSIALCSSVYMPWSTDRLGNPDNPSYIGNHFLPHSDKMSFFQRAKNAFFQEVLKILYHYYVNVPTHKMARQHFGESLPPFAEIAKNTSMLLTNTHFSIHQVRPLVPAVIEVAGLHIKPPNKLPQDLEKFISGAKHGVIYLSFGSTVRAATFPKDKLRAVVSAFAELPQRVLWKWEDDSLPDKPDNVMIRKWLPQHDILAHPNVKVFWSHGGLMGTLEAIYSGVPMVSTPLFGDQDNNVQNCIEKGISVRLRFADITKETVLEALKTILDDTRYHDNAKRASRIYHDRPRLPLDEAIYWTEYVLRHEGAYHLRSAAVNMPLYQYLLLDVIGLVGLVVVSILAVSVLVLRKLLKLCFGSRQTVHKPKAGAAKKNKVKKN